MAGSKPIELVELEDKLVQVRPELVSFLRKEKNLKQISLIHLSHRNGLPELPLEITDDNHIKTTRWIGSLSFHSGGYGVILNVSPRIGPTRLMFMLEIVLNVSVLDSPSYIRPRPGDFKGILAVAWFGAYQIGYRRHGIPKEYCLRREPHAATLKGRFDPVTNLRENTVQKHRIACEYYELTYDHPVNQSVIVVVDFLRRRKLWPFNGCSRESSNLICDRDRLKTMGVAQSSSRVAWHGVNWGRHNDAYFPAMELAHAILEEGQGTGQPSGVRITKSYFLDMAEIWELFLYRRLTEVCRSEFKNKSLKVEHPRLDLYDGYLMKYQNCPIRRLIPDFRLLNGSKNGDVIGIIDAKYKILWNEIVHKRIPSGEDITQMALYQSHDSTQKKSVPGALLYPSCDKLNPCSLKEQNYSELEISGRPSLSWWLVDLSKDKDQREFRNTVDDCLIKVLNWFIRIDQETE